MHSSAIVGGATTVSRVLGLVRDVVLANLVGATSNADAFFVAFKIPTSGDCSLKAHLHRLIPVFSETVSRRQCCGAGLVDRVAGVLGGTLLLLTALTILAAPVVAMVLPRFCQ